MGIMHKGLSVWKAFESSSSEITNCGVKMTQRRLIFWIYIIEVFFSNNRAFFPKKALVLIMLKPT